MHFDHDAHTNFSFFCRIDTGDDDKISKEEFLSEEVEHALGRWTNGDLGNMEAEFDAMDVNGGGQILFKEFIKLAELEFKAWEIKFGKKTHQS